MTPLKAVRKHCLECVGYLSNEVDECNNEIGTKYECVLHPFRYGRNPKNETLKLKTIVKYCQWCMNSRVVKDCINKECNLHQFRQGHNPNFKMSEERLKQMDKMRSLKGLKTSD